MTLSAPPPFVDLHSHILPGVDDGAQSDEVALEMLRRAAESGTTDIVATPHHNSEYWNTAASAEAGVQKLRELCPDAIRIHAGCEVTVEPSSVESLLADPAAWTINRTQYVLLELPPDLPVRAASIVMARLQNARLRPVIAHPERIPSLRENIEALELWCDAGALLQITASALTGSFGASARNAAEALLKRGLATAVASDAHGVATRSPSMLRAWQHTATRFGDAYAELLFSENPRRILEGAHVDAAVSRQRPRGLGRLVSWLS